MSNSSFRVKNNLIIGHKATNPILQFEGGSDNGYIDYTVSRTILSAGGGYMSFTTGNATRLVINSDGHVGVGSESAVSNGVRYFDVWNLASSTASITGSVIRLITTNVAGSATASVDFVKYRDGAFRCWNYETNSAAYTSFGIGTDVNSEKIRICSNGNIGIGTNSPLSRLHINDATETALRFTSNLSGSTSTDGLFIGLNSNGIDSTIWNYENGYLRFATNNVERMRIDSSGNVGIGTISPSSYSAKFAVVTSTNQAGLYVTDGTYSGAITPSSLGGMALVSNGAYPQIFYVNSAERMRIDSNGNVLIGLTASIMNTSGVLQISGYNSFGGTGYQSFLAIMNTYSSATNPQKFFRLNPTGGLEIINNAYTSVIFTLDDAGNLTTLANITAYSDVNLKENITTIDNALDKVSKMRGVMFTRKDTGVRGTGVIAQEIQEVLPEVVHEGESLSVAYGNIVGVLIEAIKELKAEIELLKGK